MKALSPVITKSAGSKDYELLYKSTTFGSKILFFITSACFLPILVNLEPVLSFWLKEVPPYTHIFIWLYLIVNIIDTAGICLPIAIAGIGKIRNYQLSTSLVTFLPMLGSILFFMYGYEAYYLYFMMIIASSIRLFIRIYFANAVCHFSLKQLLVDDMIRPGISFCLSIFILSFIAKLFSIVSYNLITIAIIFVVDILFFSICYFFVGLNNKDRNYVFFILRKYIKLKKWNKYRRV